MPTDQTPRRPRGRPAFEATDFQRRQVTALAASGNTVDVIAAVLEIGESTVRRNFVAELYRGRLLGSAANTKRLHKAAQAGSVAAMIWLDKTRFGITDRAPPAEEPLGKKAQAELDAVDAHIGSVWERVLQ